MEPKSTRKDSGNFNPFKDLQIQTLPELNEPTLNIKSPINRGR